jgi:hypothetical protein
MDRMTNPYSPGAGTPPPELAGRFAILEDARIALGRLVAGKPAQGLILTGLRGVGKTVLLNEVYEIATGFGFTILRIEAHEGKSLSEALVPPLREALFAASRVDSAMQAAKRALRVLRGFIGALNVTIDGISFGLGVEPEIGVADSGDMEADLPRLLEIVGEAAAAASKPILILLDEVQYLSTQEFSALIMGLHRVNQRQLPILLIAAGLPQTLSLAGNSKSYAERLFRYPEIGALSAEAATLALSAPAEKLGVAYEAAAIDAILDVTKRYPYFLQQWGHDAWNIASGNEVRVSDIENATNVALAELDQSFFKVRFDRCTPAERRYMYALARLGTGSHRSGDVATALGTKVNASSPVRNTLIKKGMIYAPAHGETAFTVPLFDQFMIRTMPSD